ncbi:transposase [Apiospora kogelbergensis]|uniref:Transposase n=1 Tax=Apiospora kogelbergensis TaxID=1337665 RepID=A0AAW0QVJ6_9PEZI
MDEHGIMEGQGGNGLVVGSAAIRAIHQKQPGSRHGPPFWSVYPRLAEPSLPSLFTKAKPSNSNGSLPTYSIDLQRQLRGFHQLQQTDLPTQRQLFRKIQKGFDEKDYLIMDAELRIQALETKLDLAKPRKRKRVELSPNSKFATIEDIQKTEETINEALIGESDSDTSSISTAALDCIIVQE